VAVAIGAGAADGSGDAFRMLVSCGVVEASTAGAEGASGGGIEYTVCWLKSAAGIDSLRLAWTECEGTELGLAGLGLVYHDIAAQIGWEASE
jgi:hypothetical protein